MPEKDLIHKLIVTAEDHSKFRRLDQFLSHHIKELSRSNVKDLFLKDKITSTHEKIELKKLPPIDTLVTVSIPPPRDADAKAQNIPLEIVYEDEHLLFVNKPAGMVTHPAPGNYEGTLVNAILYHCKDLKGVGDQKRPGIVHRLDKGTSGIMVVAKTRECHEGLVNLFASHDIERIYHAIVMGDHHPIGGLVDASIGRHPQNRLKMAANVKNSKNAITHYKVLEYFKKHSLFELKLETGRTHQIRVHLSQIMRSPILCDPTYGNPKEHIARIGNEYKDILDGYPHPLLHAKVLGLIHPITKEELRFEVDYPDTFKGVLNISHKLKAERK